MIRVRCNWYRAMFLAAVVGCGNSPNSSNDSATDTRKGQMAGSGLPRSSAIGSLSPEQFGILCDWTNNEQGGYGRTVNCPSGDPQFTDKDQKSCVEVLPLIRSACPTLTVADAEDCASAIGTDLCKFPHEPACAALLRCFSATVDGGVD